MKERKPTNQDLFFIDEVEVALQALTRAHQIADEAPGDTLADDAWEMIVDLEDQTRKLLRTLRRKGRQQ